MNSVRAEVWCGTGERSILYPYGCIGRIRLFMKKSSLTALTIGALGIVYGDIGTSPLYAMNEVFFGSGHLSITADHSAGTASLIFWILVVVVGVKYAGLVLRADHDGEGGVFALLSLLQEMGGRHLVPLSFLLMFAAGLLFGDGIITPAISVLSAVEGLRVAWPSLGEWVVPLTVAILAGIFLFQKKGTVRVGKIYGPIMLVWFVTIALLGSGQIFLHPEIIPAVLNPLSAFDLVRSLDVSHLMFLLGAVFLVVTGSEALFADLGHLGKRAIRVGWFIIVFPALCLNYAGQAAYLLSGAPVVGDNLFYSLVPAPLLLPMIILATASAMIASVALIFGAYSLVSQAVVLNLHPRLRVVHTDEKTEGQIYIPAVNWTLFAGSVALVLWFGSATHLASAYGFAVSGVMCITSVAMLVVAKRHWHWPKWVSVLVFGLFVVIDLGFVFANSLKFLDGGYIPFFLGGLIFSVIATWRWGRHLLRSAYDAYTDNRDMRWFLDLKGRLEAGGGFLRDSRPRAMAELDRAVVFLISRSVSGLESNMPVKLRVYLKRRGAIPKNVLLLNIEQKRVPYLRKHYQIIDLGLNVYAVRAVFGFMENPDASRVLRELYRTKIFEEKFHRCTIEASEDELIIDADLPFSDRFTARFFKFLLSLSVPRYRYFGLSGVASAGLSKTVIPVHLSREGVRIEIPEFPLNSAEDTIDPDTLLPTTIRFTIVK